MTWTLTRTLGNFAAIFGQAGQGGNGLSIGRAASGTYTDTALQIGTAASGIRASNITSDGYIDNVSMKILTTAELMASIPYTTPFVKARIYASVSNGNPAGIVVALDSHTNPQNFILALYDGQYVILYKCVSGVYTLLTNTFLNAPSAPLQVTTTQSGGNLLVDMTYNGAAVGTQQTVSDASIVSNTRHGMFSTVPENKIYSFSIR
jgi:hypothetical protein